MSLDTAPWFARPPGSSHETVPSPARPAPHFSTFVGKAGLYLEDLFVFPEYRGKGYGKGLLKALARIAVERNAGRFEWCCLNWNTPSIDFYLSCGAKKMDGWTTFRLDGKELAEFSK